jgi:hypothetical protein
MTDLFRATSDWLGRQRQIAAANGLVMANG